MNNSLTHNSASLMTLSRDIYSQAKESNDNITTLLSKIGDKIYEQSHIYYDYSLWLEQDTSDTNKYKIQTRIASRSTNFVDIIWSNIEHGKDEIWYNLYIYNTDDHRRYIGHDINLYSLYIYNVYYNQIDDDHKIPNLYLIGLFQNEYIKCAVFIELDNINTDLNIRSNVLGIIPLRHQYRFLHDYMEEETYTNFDIGLFGPVCYSSEGKPIQPLSQNNVIYFYLENHPEILLKYSTT